MNRNRISGLVLATLALAGWIHPGALVADDTSFHLELDPLVIEGLWLDQDNDSSRFQEYRDLKSGFRLRSLRLFGADDDGELSAALKLRNAGRDASQAQQRSRPSRR